MPNNRRWAAATAVHVQTRNGRVTCEMWLFWSSSFHRNFPWEPTSICRVDLCTILIFHRRLLCVFDFWTTLVTVVPSSLWHLAGTLPGSLHSELWCENAVDNMAQEMRPGPKNTRSPQRNLLRRQAAWGNQWCVCIGTYCTPLVHLGTYCAENRLFVWPWQRLQIFQIVFASAWPSNSLGHLVPRSSNDLFWKRLTYAQISTHLWRALRILHLTFLRLLTGLEVTLLRRVHAFYIQATEIIQQPNVVCKCRIIDQIFVTLKRIL